MQEIEHEFHTCMLQISENVRRRGYNPTYFLRMVHELGGVQAAKQLLSGSKTQEGLMRLWELDLLDESMEVYVLKPQFVSLFTDEERAEARRRLVELNYRVG